MRTKVYGRARPPRGSYIFAATLVNCGHAASRHIVGGPSSGDVGVHADRRACVAVRHCVNVSLDNFGVTQFSCFPLSFFFLFFSAAEICSPPECAVCVRVYLSVFWMKHGKVVPLTARTCVRLDTRIMIWLKYRIVLLGMSQMFVRQ